MWTSTNVVFDNFPEYGTATRSRATEKREPHPSREVVQVRGCIGGPTLPSTHIAQTRHSTSEGAAGAACSPRPRLAADAPPPRLRRAYAASPPPDPLRSTATLDTSLLSSAGYVALLYFEELRPSRITFCDYLPSICCRSVFGTSHTTRLRCFTEIGRFGRMAIIKKVIDENFW